MLSAGIVSEANREWDGWVGGWTGGEDDDSDDDSDCGGCMQEYRVSMYHPIAIAGTFGVFSGTA